MTLSKMRISKAFSGFPEDSAIALTGLVTAKDFKGKLGSFWAEQADRLLPLAACFSQAPISGFHVGAIAIGESGNVYLGTNLEFHGVSLNATLHAEQSALINAWMHGESAIRALHISQSPCGHCRQFIRELSNTENLGILIKGHPTTLDRLLPDAFGELIPQGKGMLDSPTLNLQAAKPESNPTRIKAIEAAKGSYVPYSSSPEGFVLECIDGETFTGQSVESVAFNPSISALIVALNQRNLSNSRDAAITKCTLAKLATTLNNPLPLARSILKALTEAPIDVVQMESAD